MLKFNEDTRVKIPATIQFLKLGYNYQSLKDDKLDLDLIYKKCNFCCKVSRK